MRSFNEAFKHSVCLRLDEIKEDKPNTNVVCDFFNELDENMKKKFLSLERAVEEEHEKRERIAYVQGMKDGARLYKELIE